jgi:hypothetical protein
MVDDSDVPLPDDPVPRVTVSSVRPAPPKYDRDKYFAHLMEQYKLYVEMLDRISARRLLANNSFVTLVGAAAIAYAAAPQHFRGGVVFFQLGISAACIMLAILWRQTIMYYSDLSDAKFKVVHEIEELLPAQPYKMEYAYFVQERRKKRGLYRIEMYLPIVTSFISALGFLYAIPAVRAVFETPAAAP